jgi:hypothetical protein
MDCAELPAVTQSQTSAQAAVPPHRAESGRHYAARVILYMEGAFLVLISFGFFSGAEGSGALDVIGGGGLCIVGAVILGVGATRMRHDVPAVRDPNDPYQKAPWDWTDFLMFWPGWFSAFQLLGSVAIILTNLIASNSDPTVRTAIESSVLAVCQYSGMLFNIFVLVFMRRGGTLRDLGWRGFQWWWLPVAPVATYIALPAPRCVKWTVPAGAARLQPLLRPRNHRCLCDCANLRGDDLPGIHLWLAASLGAGCAGDTVERHHLLGPASAGCAVSTPLLCRSRPRIAVPGIAKHHSRHHDSRALQPSEHHRDPEHHDDLLTAPAAEAGSDDGLDLAAVDRDGHAGDE